MANDFTTYRRRIEKFFTIKNIRPKRADAGTNHISDLESWDDNTTYAGEVTLNLKDGKVFTTDDSGTIELGAKNGIKNGLQVFQPPGSWSGGIPRWLAVSSGEVFINGKTYIHETSLLTGSNGDIQVEENNSSQSRYDLIYAEPTTTEINGQDFVADIKVIAGPTNLDEIIRSSFHLDENQILLGIVFVPREYTDASIHMLRPWSVSRHSSISTSDVDYTYRLDELNISGLTSKYLQDAHPSDIIKRVIESSTIDELGIPDDSELKRTFLKGQIVVSGITTYRILKTHFAGESLDSSVIMGYAIKLSSGSGGGGGESSVIAIDQLAGNASYDVNHFLNSRDHLVQVFINNPGEPNDGMNIFGQVQRGLNSTNISFADNIDVNFTVLIIG